MSGGIFPSASGIVSDMPPASIGRLTTNEAAKRLNISRRRVLQLIGEGRLPTERIGDMHLINPKDLESLKGRKPGRPPAEPKPATRRKRK